MVYSFSLSPICSLLFFSPFFHSEHFWSFYFVSTVDLFIITPVNFLVKLIWVFFSLLNPYFQFILFISKWGKAIALSNYNCVLCIFVFLFQFYLFYLMHFDTLFDWLSDWPIHSHVGLLCPFEMSLLSLSNVPPFFVLKSILFDINIDTPLFLYWLHGNYWIFYFLLSTFL